MKLSVVLLSPLKGEERRGLITALQKVPCEFISDFSQLRFPGKFLFVVKDRYSPGYQNFMAGLYGLESVLSGSVAGFFLESPEKELALALGTLLCQKGCAILPQPLVCQKEELPLLAERLMGLGFRGYSPRKPQQPKLLCVCPDFTSDSPFPQVSNAMLLWEELSRRLSPFMEIKTLSLADQVICPFAGCQMLLPTLQSVVEADALLLISPVFHHSLSPMLLGFLQKLAELPLPFQDTAVFSLVVSQKNPSHPGGNFALQQLVSLLSVENSFYLPGQFALEEEVEEEMEAISRGDFEHRLDRFSQQIFELLSFGNLV